MNTPSYLSSKQILENSILQSIPYYLRAGETSRGMIKKHKGDLLETIRFLRKRAFSAMNGVKRSKSTKKRKSKKKKP